ncbi:hypothetical protein SNOG_09253 [Parastagonospora nodorum SN15]|uniref:Uncharacterized protein n=1 Tax=Phaeosphaeria nodorum (strain SN15 / ATCC MYA-4574 / FGSC 10173) TaxID=321614 RepID=Q0UG61_PHANO|nr:hypothetical protein SNOG_09253 [Parastagonospora nodorum SN15]EAT83445.1 hypothetical protein SNOG_09253 [Parastagonospora nodorum SN15]
MRVAAHYAVSQQQQTARLSYYVISVRSLQRFAVLSHTTNKSSPPALPPNQPWLGAVGKCTANPQPPEGLGLITQVWRSDLKDVK